jgi:hypothetical protein
VSLLLFLSSEYDSITPSLFASYTEPSGFQVLASKKTTLFVFVGILDVIDHRSSLTVPKENLLHYLDYMFEFLFPPLKLYTCIRRYVLLHVDFFLKKNVELLIATTLRNRK